MMRLFNKPRRHSTLELVCFQCCLFFPSSSMGDVLYETADPGSPSSSHSPLPSSSCYAPHERRWNSPESLPLLLPLGDDSLFRCDAVFASCPPLSERQSPENDIGKASRLHPRNNRKKCPVYSLIDCHHR